MFTSSDKSVKNVSFSREIISKVEDPEEKALYEIQKHLKVAEKDTKDIAAAVASMSVNSEQIDTSIIERVCKSESAIRTLRSSLDQLRSEKSVLKKRKMEKFTQAADAYEKEVSSLQRDIVVLKRSLKKAENENESAKLLISNNDTIKIKLQRKIDELKAELSRETSVRKSLEDAHRSSQKRLQEMECFSSSERDNLSSLTASCSSLKKEMIHVQHEAAAERQRRVITENTIKAIKAERDEFQKKFETTTEERDKIIKELEKMRIDFSNLTEKLEKAQKAGAVSLVRDEQLREALREAAAHNAKLLAECEESAEKARSLSQASNNEEALKKQLLMETRSKCDLRRKLEECEAIVNERNQEIELLRAEQAGALKEKDNLLDEVNDALDNVVEERKNVESQLDELVEELKKVEKERDEYRMEIGQLRERIASSMQHERAQQQLERTLAHLTEQKQRLSYEKGRLESKVDDLQRELEDSGSAKAEAVKLRELVDDLKDSLTKAERDYDLVKADEIRLRNELELVKESCNRKERDFQEAVKSRDETLQELKKIKEKANSLNEKSRAAELGWKEALDVSHRERKQLATQLNQVVSAHSQLQSSVDKLQIEMGKRDDKCCKLTDENEELKKKVDELEKERMDWALRSEEQTRALNSFTKQVSSVREDVQLLRNQHYPYTSSRYYIEAD